MMNDETEKDQRNAEYLAMIDESMEQIKQGKVVIKTMTELEEMAGNGKEENPYPMPRNGAAGE